MDPQAFRIIERKRGGERLDSSEIAAVVAGAAALEGEAAWGEAELAAFLMAAAIRGLDDEETRQLTVAMLESGERWELAREIPLLGDKHSTGGVGDKVSLVLAPLLAACDRPVVMLTGRGLGHTGGTADKLEVIPGLDLALDRQGCLRSLERHGLAIGVATGAIAPADKRLYALRDRTATVSSLPLITASILSKKLATGAAAIVFDVKTGDGAFLPEYEASRELAKKLVSVTELLGKRASALVTDMSQPLGRWVGHTAEVRETLECLSGDGPEDTMEVTYALCLELAQLVGQPLQRADLERAITSGRAREVFDRWAVEQGADAAWLAAPDLRLAPVEVALLAPHEGWIDGVRTKRLGELLATAGGGRLNPGAAIDFQVSLELRARIGDAIGAGEELGRLYLRREDPLLVERFTECFSIGDPTPPPPTIHGRFGGTYAR